VSQLLLRIFTGTLKSDISIRLQPHVARTMSCECLDCTRSQRNRPLRPRRLERLKRPLEHRLPNCQGPSVEIES